MSQNNNTDAGTVIAFVFAGFAMMAYVAFAFFAFLTFVMTILAICAWNKPLRLGRNFVVTPEESHAFIGRGIAGMVVLPAFVFFANVFLSVHINWDYLPHLLVLGYVTGSLGVEMMMANDKEAAAQSQPQQAPMALPQQPVQQVLPPAPREPFHYANWEDEEENRR